MNRVRIGNGCGFWGDNLDAPILLAENGQLDYLTLEYLAELTMSILALQKQRDPKTGYATDFLDVLSRLTPILKKQPNLKIITNAGGMNPPACAEEAKRILEKADLSDRKIAIVSGDDLFPRLDSILEKEPLLNLDTNEPLSQIRSQVVSANAYLGARPIVEGLLQGASIVITGRVADASLTVGPAMHEFQWGWDDWNRLSSATVAGHLIECGAQVTGGLWCNWEENPDFANVGYPIAEIDLNGIIQITKPPSSGGVVNIETVSEQLLYEVGDPREYLTPDVISDFTSVNLKQTNANSVEIHNSHGKVSTESYKVSIAYRNGFMSSGTLVLLGPKAREKAHFAGKMLLDRLRRMGLHYEKTHIECLGSGDCVSGISGKVDSPEVVLRVSVKDTRKQVVERFTKEFAPLVTSGPPGVTGYTLGRPPVREVFAYWPTLISKSLVDSFVECRVL